MISLFSSFDLFFYNLSWFSISIISFVLSTKFWGRNLLSGTIERGFYLMSTFFKRLNSFRFKLFNNFILRLILRLIIVNMFSILPFFFSFTSQVSFNLFWGLSLWGGLFIFSLINNVKYILIHFIPEGTPVYLIWFLFFVELVSNFIRPLTLVVRLLANILAGHLLMILLSKIVFFIPPFVIFYFFLNLVEFFVSIIQSYIFVTIICLYFSEMS